MSRARRARRAPRFALDEGKRFHVKQRLPGPDPARTEPGPRMMYATPMEVTALQATIDNLIELAGDLQDAMCDAEHTTELDVNGLLRAGRLMAVESAAVRGMALAIREAGHDVPPF